MDTGSDKDAAWQSWDRAEIRRLASREAQLLQEFRSHRFQIEGEASDMSVEDMPE